MSLYAQHGMKKKPPITEDMLAKATGRQWRNSMWTYAYRIHHRNKMLWFAVFLLLFALLGLGLLMIPIIAKYGRP